MNLVWFRIRSGSLVGPHVDAVPVVLADTTATGGVAVPVEDVASDAMCLRDMQSMPRIATGQPIGMELRPGSPLRGHVPHVVGGSPEEQMVQAHAESVIAVMADLESGRDRAELPFPDEPVRVSRPSGHAEMAVSVAGGTRPFPAPVRYSNLAPEPLHASYANT